MTAINIIQKHDAIYFITDTAFIDNDGSLACTSAKVINLPQARCGVAVSGRMSLLNSLRIALSTSVSIDEVIADLRLVLPDILKQMADESGGNNFGIYVGGFSESRERHLWRIEGTVSPSAFNVVRCDADCQHYTPQLSPDMLLSAVGKTKAAQFNANFLAALNMPSPLEQGLIAIEAQRNHFTLIQQKPARTVGGSIIYTAVTYDLIAERLVSRWPDEICQRIGGERNGYKSTDGIAAGSSSNYTVDTSGMKVSPTIGANAQIAQATGTAIGNMTSGGGLAASFDSTTSQAQVASSGGAVFSISGYNNTVGKDWGSGNTKTILQYKVWGPSDANILGGGGGTTLKLQGSNDNSNWTDLTSGDSFPTGSGQSINITSGITTSTAYRYHRVNGNGNGSNTIAYAEVQFFEAGATNNMTLVTPAQTADASVSNVRVLLEIDNTATPTLNTDLTVEVTCNGGTNWASASLSSVGLGQDGRLVVESVDQACTAGTSVQARIKTLNNKAIPIHGVTVTWH